MIGAVALACWVMTVYKLRHLVRDPRNPALRYLCLTLASLSLSLSLDPFDAALDRIVGTRDVGMVIGNCLVVIAAGSAQAVLMYLPGTGDNLRRRVRNRNAVMLACVVLLVAGIIWAAYRLNAGSFTTGVEVAVDQPVAFTERVGAFLLESSRGG